MKKVIFSAIMMMAFVGSSFGKTGEVELKNENLVNVNESISAQAQIPASTTVVLGSCLDAAVAAYRGAVDCMGEDRALDLALKVEEACLEAKYWNC